MQGRPTRHYCAEKRRVLCHPLLSYSIIIASLQCLQQHILPFLLGTHADLHFHFKKLSTLIYIPSPSVPLFPCSYALNIMNRDTSANFKTDSYFPFLIFSFTYFFSFLPCHKGSFVYIFHQYFHVQNINKEIIEPLAQVMGTHRNKKITKIN